MWVGRRKLLPWAPLLSGGLVLASCGERPVAPHPPLVVESVTPRPGALLFLNQEIRVEFNTEIDPISVTPSTVRVLDAQGNAVRGRRTIRSRSVSFTPFPPLLPDLSDGSFQTDRVYRLQVVGFPLANSVRSAAGRVLQEGISREFRTVSRAPAGYPSPLLPVGVGIEPFRLRLEGALTREIAAGSGRLQVQFSLPVLPTSLGPEAFEVLIFGVNDTRSRTLTPVTARLLSLPPPIDRYPGSTVELALGDVDLVPGDLVALRLTGGRHALRDYRGRELEVEPAASMPPWTVIEGDRVPLAEWPDGIEEFEPTGRAEPSFVAGPDGIRPRLSVEAGDGSLGPFRPTRDTVLRPGVPFDRGDGVVVQTPSPAFNFRAIEIPRGVTVRVESTEPVQILSLGDIDIAGTLQLMMPRAPSVGDELRALLRAHLSWPASRVAADLLLRESGVSLFAAGGIAVSGRVMREGDGTADTSPLSLIAGSGIDLRGPIPSRTVLADPAGRVTGSAENYVVFLTAMTEGVSAGSGVTLTAFSSWRGIPAAHTGKVRVVVEPDPDRNPLEVLVQTAPPDPVDPSRPDGRPELLAAPQPLSSMPGGFDVPTGGFVRLMLRADVRGGAPMPGIRRVQLVGN